MFNKISLVISILLLLSCTKLFAEPPLDYEPSNNSNPAKYPDLQKYINANYLLVFVNNLGSLGYDESQYFGKADGWYYPSAMHPAYPGENTVIYSSGLWLGGKVNDEIRVAIAEYGSEYVTGPMENGTYLPDDPSFRVYKIDQTSGPGDPDWDEWPADQGAPVDEFGDPLLLGDETLWTVYNDANADMHDEYNTDPLGVEVQKTVWASDDPGEEIVLYVKYLLYNKGENYIDSFYISFWADPDLGDPSDDLVGCDTTSDIFYCYNDGLDDDYGANTPAWGGKLLSGPVSPSPGDMAIFYGQPLPDYRNLGMTAFTKHINGLDPNSSEEIFNHMKGLNIDGSPMTDPDGVVTKHYSAGDPVTGIGWVDEASADRRLMMTTGPLSFNPGDSQQVVFKFAVDHGSNHLQSITKLKNTLNFMASNVNIDPIVVAPVDSVQLLVENFGRLAGWYWEPEYTRWISGYNWGGSTFFGSTDIGLNFFGSSLDPLIDATPFTTVEIRFSNSVTQKGHRYIRGHPTNSYNFVDYVDVPFTLWDVENNRQLNVCFVENYGDPCEDGTWGPCDTDQGGREYVFMMASDYSETANPIYDDILWDIIDFGNFDNLYTLWPRERYSGGLSELADGQVLGFFPQLNNANGVADTILLTPHESQTTVSQTITINTFGEGNTLIYPSLSKSDLFYAYPTIFNISGNDSMELSVSFRNSLAGPGEFQSILTLRDNTSDEIVGEVLLIGQSLDLHIGNSVLEPDTIHAYYAFEVGPDTTLATMYFGDFEGSNLASQVLTNTIKINNQYLPYDTWITTHPYFDNDVLACTFRLPEFVAGYGPMWGITDQPFSVSGKFNDNSSFHCDGSFRMIGHRVGDANTDGQLDISDAVFLISYIFDNGSSPEPLSIGDCDCNESVDISDTVYLIRYIFGNGPIPCSIK